jgi:hypothetical protein
MNRLGVLLQIVIVGGLFYALFHMIATQPKAAAEALPVCRAAIVLDRSASVGADNLNAMEAQIGNLFDPTTGFYNDQYQIAFWSFASSTSRTSNYDTPYHDFVSTRGHNSQFDQALGSLKSEGATNYEQGLGYDGYAFGNQKINNYGTPSVSSIIQQADVVVFMSDGVPNVPGQGDNNSQAINAAVAAATNLRNGTNGAGKKKLLAGGIVQPADQSTMNLVLNGDKNNGSNIFSINSDYSNLFNQLKASIGDQCSKVVPPGPAADYSLIPTVTSNESVASGTSSATFSYAVNNASNDASSQMTNWSIKRLIVSRGQAVDGLFYGSDTYRDGYSCDDLKRLVNGNARCDDNIAQGQRVFGPGTTSLDDQATGSTTVAIDDSWGVGTKVCYVLVLNQPTQAAAPADRHSRAACLTVGTRPSVQIRGGDLRVGRHFASDRVDPTVTEPPAGVMTSTVTRNQADGSVRTYGSWVEYGVFSPGVVVGFASLSGLAGGAVSNVQDEWSKLTFANVDNNYGQYTDSNVSGGTIPDAASALLQGRSVTRDLTGVGSMNINGAGFANGLYQKTDGDLTLDTSVFEPGKTVIVNVPNGTLTIGGNVTYSDGPYTDISQIPQLILIAKNIVIKEDVVNVDAWLIANGEGGDGRVNTCDNAATLTSEICNKQLTINGAVQARHLDLRRTGGSGPGGAAGDPAEIINLPATSYLWAQSEGKSDARAQTTLTTELPPYF